MVWLVAEYVPASLYTEPIFWLPKATVSPAIDDVAVKSWETRKPSVVPVAPRKMPLLVALPVTPK